MSKSRGNIVAPWEVLDRFGADALRWYFFTTKQPWDGYRFSTEAVGDGVRLFLRQLWNVYGFFVLYAKANAIDAGERLAAPQSDLDLWALSRLSATIAAVREHLDAYDATSAGRAIADWVVPHRAASSDWDRRRATRCSVMSWQVPR